MDIQKDLLAEIAAFLEERGIAESTFGRLSVNNPKLGRNLREGTVHVRTVEKVRAFIAEERSRAARAAAQ